VYVDDVILIRSSLNDIEHVKTLLHSAFKIKKPRRTQILP